MPSVKHARQSFNHAQEIAAAREFERNESMIHHSWKKQVVMTKLPKRQISCIGKNIERVDR